MYGKMQGSGLTEIIPLICTSASGSGISASWVSSDFTLSSSYSLMTPRWLVFLFFLSFLRDHQLTMAIGCTWWGGWHPLFTDKASNIPFLTWDSSPPIFPLKTVMAEQNLWKWSSLCPYCQLFWLTHLSFLLTFVSQIIGF